MDRRVRTIVKLALAAELLFPVAALTQKPPSPAPPANPRPSQPTLPSQPIPTNSGPVQPTEDMVMFLGGHIATNDGSTVPNDALIERVCRERVRQQVYAAPGGDFTMQLGSRSDTYADAGVERDSQFSERRKNTELGIPRQELTNCDLRASASGFLVRVVSLVEFNASGGRIDVGSIMLQRAAKVEGQTLNAAPYRAPKGARLAYERGLEAERKGKTADARRYFERAVQIYPKFASAWFLLGGVLEKENEHSAAREAFIKATNIDPKFLSPYLALASMAAKQENWVEARNITDHILELDPLNHASIAGGIWDLDPGNPADAYFYNALANYKLNNFQEAEKSALKAEQRVDLNGRFPQLHLLLADLFNRKNKYDLAISEIQTYLELVPNAQDAEQVREQLATLKRLSSAKPASEKSEQE